MSIKDVEIQVLSPLHLGCGKANVIIDADVVYDKYGLPYFPGKRFKGLLYESALEIAEMAKVSDYAAGDFEKFTERDINILFGQDSNYNTGIIIENLYLNNYDKLLEEWCYLHNKYSEIFTTEAVISSYTELRYHTSINKSRGIAKEHSLHNMRVVEPGIAFKGKIKILNDEDDIRNKINESIVMYAIKNLRFAGSKRNRGYGKIKCTIVSSKK